MLNATVALVMTRSTGAGSGPAASIASVAERLCPACIAVRLAAASSAPAVIRSSWLSCPSGMVMLDVIYNLWSWNQGSLDSAGASIADTFAGMLGMN